MYWLNRMVGRQLLKHSTSCCNSTAAASQLQISQTHTLANAISSLFKRTSAVLSRGCSVALQPHPSLDNNNGATAVWVPARDMSHRSRQKGIQTGPLAPGSLWQKRSDGLLHPENVGSQKVNPRSGHYLNFFQFPFCKKNPTSGKH